MRILVFFSLILLLSCSQAKEQEQDLSQLSWPEIAQLARGSTVHMMMWQGDPLINAYMQEYVAKELKERYGIELRIAGGQGNIIVQNLMAELQAGKQSSALDLLWINGETFYQLRQIDALHGPWTDSLPNAAFIDWENPFIALDFQQPVQGFECPWGNVQMALIYNSAEVPSPPRNREELAAFIKTHPGRFTFDVHFTGLTFLKILLMDIAGGGGGAGRAFQRRKIYQVQRSSLGLPQGYEALSLERGQNLPRSRGAHAPALRQWGDLVFHEQQRQRGG